MCSVCSTEQQLSILTNNCTSTTEYWIALEQAKLLDLFNFYFDMVASRQKSTVAVFIVSFFFIRKTTLQFDWCFIVVVSCMPRLITSILIPINILFIIGKSTAMLTDIRWCWFFFSVLSRAPTSACEWKVGDEIWKKKSKTNEISISGYWLLEWGLNQHSSYCWDISAQDTSGHWCHEVNPLAKYR